jgi:hypothetical protein
MSTQDPEREDDLLEEQEGKGYGEDEGERDESLREIEPQREDEITES